MRVFKTKDFARFARREGISDKSLVEAAKRAEEGHIDADLGGGLIKQRVPRPGQGRSSGFRTIVAWRAHDCGFFVYGFPKSGKANLTTKELETYRDFAAVLLALGDDALKEALATKKIMELKV